MKLDPDQIKRVSRSLENLAGGVLYYRENRNSSSMASEMRKQAMILEQAFLDAQRPLEALLDHTNDQ